MGKEADDTLLPIKISNDDKKEYDKVIAKFDSFFKLRKNAIFERAKFNRRCQKQDESVEQFITCLYQRNDTRPDSHWHLRCSHVAKVRGRSYAGVSEEG